MDTIADIDHKLELPTQFIVRRNQSLSWRGNKIFIIYVGILSFSIAGVFALHGLWLILPFVGLEILILSVALYICCLRNRYKEVITIEDEKLIVEKGIQQPNETWEFDRAWINLELRDSKLLGHPSKLLIRSKGSQTEIGECLTDEEKQSLAKSLMRTLHTTLNKS